MMKFILILYEIPERALAKGHVMKSKTCRKSSSYFATGR